jgi:CRP/FNR family cyclic AMP-dependent transcriptional regulator
MLRELATRLRAASTKIGELALYDVQDRVLRTLTALAKTAPSERTEGGVVHTVQKRPTHQELAAMVGATREGVTRALKSLEEEGAIQIDGKTITVLSCDNDE